MNSFPKPCEFRPAGPFVCQHYMLMFEKKKKLGLEAGLGRPQTMFVTKKKLIVEWSAIFFFIKKRIQVATWPALHCVVECTSAFTFKDHLDVTGHRTNSIGGVASVEALLRHCQRGAKTAWLFVGVPEPHYMRRGVSVSVTDELLRVTVEHRDCLWKFCDVNGGLICWDNKGSREGRVYENAHSCTVRTCV